MSAPRFRVVRKYQREGVPDEVVVPSCSKQEAIDRCNDPDTSYATCSTDEGKARTAEKGPWFDAWEEVDE